MRYHVLTAYDELGGTLPSLRHYSETDNLDQAKRDARSLHSRHNNSPGFIWDELARERLTYSPYEDDFVALADHQAPPTW